MLAGPFLYDILFTHTTNCASITIVGVNGPNNFNAAPKRPVALHKTKWRRNENLGLAFEQVKKALGGDPGDAAPHLVLQHRASEQRSRLPCDLHQTSILLRARLMTDCIH